DLNQLDMNNPLGLNLAQHDLALPSLEPALQRLAEHHCIGIPQGPDDVPNTPLVLYAGRLYLQRYWGYESALAQTLKAKVNNDSQLDMARASALLEQLFPSSQQDNTELDWQKMACATALVKNFAVITGGPGTGKTTTVTKLLALLVLLHVAPANQQQNPIIKLVTPTGKAAARLSESIKGAKAKLALSEQDKALIPEEASTIHRLLGVKPHSSEFIHHQGNRLHLDVLVVDEISMVDLPMMAKLMAALPEKTKVILLGDKDQLSSVEAGSVLADICARISDELSFSQVLLGQLQVLLNRNLSGFCPSTPQVSLADSICLLQKSHRFDDSSGIGQLAKAVNLSDWSRVKQIQASSDRSLFFSGISPSEYQHLVVQCARAYQPYLQMIREQCKPELIIEAFNRFQLLCGLRKGAYGVAGMNEAIEKQLVKMGLIDNRQLYYAGRPIMVSQNDYSLKLFNGDVGVILADPITGHLKAWFLTPDHKDKGGDKDKEKVKSVYPNRLPSHDSVYAMTVHKSQGSEFEQVAMLLPPLAQVMNNQVITKELIYTGITRAKNQFNLFAEPRVLQIAIRQTTQRSSGLAELLYT
ncbi:MAG: exodeoxyribonuclease V alpha subunit, partial [Alteromonadaceae bacterium]